MADQQPATPETVAVYARVRGGPDSTNEISVVPETPEKIRATGATGTNYEFHLDRGFDTTATQEELFVAVGSKLVDSVVSGYNACIIAYGQTGSGKTFTMLVTRPGPQPRTSSLGPLATPLLFLPHQFLVRAPLREGA